MEAAIYFSNDDALVSSTQIRLGSYAFSPADVQSFDVRVKMLGMYRRWELALAWLPPALWVLAFFISIARFMSDFVHGTLGDPNSYANDFVGFLPALGSLLGLVIYPWLIREPTALFSVTLRDSVLVEAGETIRGAISAINMIGSLTLGDALSKASGLTPLSSRKKYSMANPADIDWGEPVLYEDAFAKVNIERAWLAGNLYRIADLDNVRVNVSSDSRYYVVRLLLGIIWSSLVLFQNLPTLLTKWPLIENGTLLFPQEWLTSFSILVMLIAAALVVIKFYIVSRKRLQPKHTATVLLTGRLGRYDRKVVFTQVALVTSDVQQANLVVGGYPNCHTAGTTRAAA